jgi:hypothetical protein
MSAEKMQGRAVPSLALRFVWLYFRTDLLDMQGVVFIDVQFCRKREDFPDNTVLFHFSIFGGAFVKLPLCRYVNMATYSRIELATRRPFWRFVGRCLC